MDVFKVQNLLEFSDRFKTDEDCKKYLASMKSEIRYKCLKCNHTACQVRADFARQCNICGHIESPTANTLFHKVKFGIRKAFFICFEMATRLYMHTDIALSCQISTNLTSSVITPQTFISNF